MRYTPEEAAANMYKYPVDPIVMYLCSTCQHIHFTHGTPRYLRPEMARRKKQSEKDRAAARKRANIPISRPKWMQDSRIF
jgi:hypothetical protein